MTKTSLETTDFRRIDSAGSITHDLDAAVLPRFGVLETQLSFVVAVQNNETTLEQLALDIMRYSAGFGAIEIIFVDDGSSDESWSAIKAISYNYPAQVRGIRLRAGRSTSAALMTGFQAAEGKIIFTMAADLRDDPREIRRLLMKLDQGYDLVSGRDRNRCAGLLSATTKRLVHRFTKVSALDNECSFRCYRKSVTESIDLRGDHYKMAPVLAKMLGFKVAEIAVENRIDERAEIATSRAGRPAKCRNTDRSQQVSDAFTLQFLRAYRERPGHFANAVVAMTAVPAAAFSVLSFFVGFFSSAGLLLLAVSLMMFAVSGICLFVGLVTELLIRHENFVALPSTTAKAIIGDTRKRDGKTWPPATHVRETPRGYAVELAA